MKAILNFITTLSILIVLTGCTTRFVYTRIHIESKGDAIAESETLFEADQDGNAGDNKGNSVKLPVVP